MQLGRRATLYGAAASFAAAGPPSSRGLNAQAAANNLFFGAAIDDRILVHDHAYMAHVRTECGMLTGETAFKWGEVHPKPGAWNWRPADALMAFAARNGQRVRGHTLLWHEHNPAWLTSQLDASTAERLLTSHIRGLAGHCRHRVVQWDVVNEVLLPGDHSAMGFRDTLWYRALGPRFLDVAFHVCADTDPAPLRCINEYGLEYAWDEHEQKRNDMLALLTRLVSSGVPVQALGLQSHLEAGVDALDQKRLAQFCADVAALGLKIVVTELDVRDNRLPADPAVRDAAVASHTRAYLDAVLSCPAVVGVMSWGLSDRRTWLDDTLPRADGLPQRPLPLDAELRRKPLWTAIGQAFAAAPPRAHPVSARG